MIRLFRIIHWAARARYWRQRAVRAESQCAAQATQLQAEAYRNREREDYFVSAAVMGGRGMVGIGPRTGPAEAPQPRNRLTATPNPWDALTSIERMEFQTQWLPDALASGVSEPSARARFMAELQQRKSFNDGGVM